MIKKLRRHFVFIAMVSIGIITGGIIGLIMTVNYISVNRQINEIMGAIVDNDGSFDNYKFDDKNSLFIYEETSFSTRYFTVVIDDDDNIVEMNLDSIAAVDSDDALEMVSYVMDEDKLEGFYNNYKYNIVSVGDRRLIIFLDCTMQLNGFRDLMKKSLMVVGIGMVVVFLIVLLLSKRAIRPIERNIEKQKQFITNAGHELKTPLAIILADIDVLELEVGSDNEWISSLRGQARRLDVLVHRLLDLSNVEEGKMKVVYESFCFNDLIEEEIGEFKLLLGDKKIEYDNNEKVMVWGDKNLIKQLLTILVENAIKYASDDGAIVISVGKDGKNVKLEVINDCDDTSGINTSKLFDRFYREDKSRNSKKQGYGIGLSIAKSIVELHNGRISAYVRDDSKICFRVII